MAQEKRQQFKCPGDCLQCLPAQRQYCASQHAYSNMKVLDRMMEELMRMQDGIRVLTEKIEAIENSEAAVFADGGEMIGNPDLFPREYPEEGKE